MRSFSIVLTGLALSTPGMAQPVPDASLSARIERVVAQAIAEKRLVGTVVLVSRAGKIVHRQAAGLADREAGRPMSEDTIFRLASVTKPMVSAAAMKLVEEGGLRLDDPVTRFLPDFRPALADRTQPTITVRQLLTHTSGLSYRFFEPPGSAYHKLDVSDGLDQPGLSLQENLRRLGQAPLGFAPGTKWGYSLGLDVLGGVLEAASGDRLPVLVQRLVTGPLGLKDTGFAVADPARLAVAYVDGKLEPVKITDGMLVPFGESKVSFSPNRVFDPASFPSGGAGMVGTAGDILTFLETIRTGGGTILRRDTIATMMRDQVGAQAATQGPGWGFGYGWAVLDDPKAAATPQAKGTLQWGGAYGHSWFIDPANELIVVALTNTTFEGMAGPFVTQLRDAAYGAAR
jgi:CubicO group peptidase (beta-lactamase class C family)